MGDMSLSNARGNAGKEEQAGTLHTTDLFHQPTSIVGAALSDEAGCHLSRVWDVGLLLSCLLGHRVVVIIGSRASNYRLMRRTWSGMGVGKGKERIEMAANRLPELVDMTIEDARVDDKDGDGNQCDGNPARPAVVSRGEPPHKDGQPNNQPDVWPNSCQDGCGTDVGWTSMWLDTDIYRIGASIGSTSQRIQGCRDMTHTLFCLGVDLLMDMVLDLLCCCMDLGKHWFTVGANGTKATASHKDEIGVFTKKSLLLQLLLLLLLLASRCLVVMAPVLPGAGIEKVVKLGPLLGLVRQSIVALCTINQEKSLRSSRRGQEIHLRVLPLLALWLNLRRSRGAPWSSRGRSIA